MRRPHRVSGELGEKRGAAVMIPFRVQDRGGDADDRTAAGGEGMKLS
jgi:hypothetical protein